MFRRLLQVLDRAGLLDGLRRLVVLLFIGCASTLEKKEEKELEKAREAATEAEKRLSELRQERMKLEKEFEEKGDINEKHH